MKTTTIKLASLILTSALVSACQTLPKYSEVSSGPQAKLRVLVPNPEQYSVWVVKAGLNDCKAESYLGWASGGAEIDQHRVRMIDSKPVVEGTIERRIPANSKIAVGPGFMVPKLNAGQILFHRQPGTQAEIHAAQAGTCNVPVFIPEPDAEYELTIHPRPGSCSINLHRLSLDANNKVLRTPVQSAQNAFMVMPPTQNGCAGK